MFISKQYCFFHQRTPVYMAAEEGHLDIVKYLVDKERADIHIKDNYEVGSYSIIAVPIQFLPLLTSHQF